MSGIKLVKAADRRFDAIGEVKVARDVGPDISSTLAAGVAVFENCSLDWTLTYDEYIYCINGELTLKTAKETYVLEPGSGIWLPKGTSLTYVATARTETIFSVYPANWRDLK